MKKSKKKVFDFKKNIIFSKLFLNKKLILNWISIFKKINKKENILILYNYNLFFQWIIDIYIFLSKK